jgi:pimeloyl-ACP methyl ester carboxylesterase
MHESGYVEFPGSRIYYEVDGDGPALTLVHAGVAHLRMWDAQVEQWRNRFKIVRYDERGFGQSKTEDVPYSNYDDLRRVLDHVGVEKTHLLGTSRGGMIALDFTLENPDRVRSLILVAAGVGGFESDDDPRLADMWPEIERLYEAKDYEKAVEIETQIWTDGPGQPSTRVDPDVRRRMFEWNLENFRAEQDAPQVQRLDPPAAQRLGEISVPTLVMWGLLDPIDTDAAGKKLVSDIPNVRSHVFPDVAHMISLEKPSEFNKLVIDFLDEVERSAD